MKTAFTDEYISLNAWKLLCGIRRLGGTRKGTLTWTYNDGSTASIGYEASLYERYVRLYYSVDGRSHNYRVAISNTSCNFGGFRFWFRCPLMCEGRPCNRRVDVMYLCGDYFGCRTCHGLAYRSQYDKQRNAFAFLMRSYDLLDEVERLESTIKRQTYRGRLTKKQRRLERLGGRAVSMQEISLRLHMTKELGQ